MDRSSTMPPESKSASFIQVTCTCGRALRAKPEQAGTEIRCWDCQRLVMVTVPRERQQVARDLSHGLLGVIRGPSLRHVMVAAAALTAALAFPMVGLVAAGLALTVGAALYGEVIRRVSRADTEEGTRGWFAALLPRSFFKALFCALMAAGTVVPLWCLNLDPGRHRSPHWSVTSVGIASLAWTVIPIAMLCLYGSDRTGRLGVWRCLGLLARHPLALLLALVVVPLSLAMVEVALGFAFFEVGYLPFFTLDFMPIPGSPTMIEGVPHYHQVDYRSFPPTRFYAAYLGGLRHGYLFSSSIPASLSLPTRAGLSASILHPISGVYFVIRLVLSWMIATFLLTGFAIQARWLGAIASLDKRRPA